MILRRSLGNVDDPDLRPLPAAIAVDAERPCEMHRCTPEPGQRLAELFARGAERDALDRPPVARDGAQAQMAPVGADRHYLGETMARQGEHRLRRPRAKGAGSLEAMDEFRRRGGRHQGRVDLETRFGGRERAQIRVVDVAEAQQ